MSDTGSNIVLCGLSGSGKSAVGWQLAQLMGYGFVDTDRVVTHRLGKPVSKVFAEDGESGFRVFETKALQELQGIQRHVIAIGGGALQSDTNFELTKRLGVMVWLNPPLTHVVQHLTGDIQRLMDRPLLKSCATESNAQERQRCVAGKLQAQLDERQGRYAQAQVVFEGSYATAETNARHLREYLVQNGYVTFTHEPLN